MVLNPQKVIAEDIEPLFSGGSVDPVRKVLLQIGILAGYSRANDRIDGILTRLHEGTIEWSGMESELEHMVKELEYYVYDDA